MIVATFRDLPPALIAKNVLDTAGIRNFLIDATTIRIDWFLSNAIGGVKLGVERKDLEAAKQALDRGMETVELPEDEEVLLPHCPRCMSPTVEEQKLNSPAGELHRMALRRLRDALGNERRRFIELMD